MMKPRDVTDGTYVITVRGVVGPWVRSALDDVTVSAAADRTMLRSAGTDRAAPHGLLRRIQDLGLELLDLHLESAEPASSTSDPVAAVQDTGTPHG